jgi:hypothetical protein
MRTRAALIVMLYVASATAASAEALVRHAGEVGNHNRQRPAKNRLFSDRCNDGPEFHHAVDGEIAWRQLHDQRF